MRTIINPKMISRSRNIQLLLPVFFWYLETRRGPHDQESLDVKITSSGEYALGGDNQLLYRLGHLNRRLFDIIFHTIQQGPLVNDHGGKVLKQHSEVGNRLGYLRELSITLPQIWLEIVLCLQLRLECEMKNQRDY